MGQLIVLIVRSSIRDDFNQVHSHPFLNQIQRISESISVFKKCVTKESSNMNVKILIFFSV